ncbi:MAG: hypothetical protein GXO96_07080 [Nitrospirae bacterium]|nr:hypothetical protein [Candidatus Manganitrophaceae bacterium]
MSDCVFPLVFPDYLISVPRPSIKLDIPDFLPFDDIVEDFLDDKTAQLPDLGHAGVLFIADQGNRGATKYYEYGRYRSDRGETRRRPMPNCRFIDGRPELKSLISVFRQVSFVAGQRGRVNSVFIETPGKFYKVLDYAKRRVQENKNQKRKPYNIINNSCIHFVMSVVGAAGIRHESSFTDARPISYINGLQENYPDVKYKSGQLIIEGW